MTDPLDTARHHLTKARAIGFLVGMGAGYLTVAYLVAHYTWVRIPISIGWALIAYGLTLGLGILAYDRHQARQRP